ncbi:MAG: AMP-binding protein, partial [Actinomycetota bacterium]|nr:AMP-binding protein [Actinomycetota bacterium]
MNFARDVVEAADPRALAVVELARTGRRREWTFAAIARAARTMAARLHGEGVRRGDVVLTLAGNEPDWVATLTACFRQGYV